MKRITVNKKGLGKAPSPMLGCCHGVPNATKA